MSPKRYGEKTGPLLTLDDLTEAVVGIVAAAHRPSMAKVHVDMLQKQEIQQAIKDYRKEMRQNALSRQERADLSEWLRTAEATLPAMSIAGAILSWGGESDDPNSTARSWPVPTTQQGFADCCSLLALVPRWAHAAMDRLAHKSATWAVLADNWGELQSLVMGSGQDKEQFDQLLQQYVGTKPPADLYKTGNGVREDAPAYGAEPYYPDDTPLSETHISKFAKGVLKRNGFSTVGEVRERLEDALRELSPLSSRLLTSEINRPAVREEAPDYNGEEEDPKFADNLRTSMLNIPLSAKQRLQEYGYLTVADLRPHEAGRAILKAARLRERLDRDVADFAVHAKPEPEGIADDEEPEGEPFFADDRPLTDIPMGAETKQLLLAHGFTTAGSLRKSAEKVRQVLKHPAAQNQVRNYLRRRR